MFKYIVLGSALFIAMWSATFSITGIAQVFSGSMVPVALAATSMEIGKIISISLLYRYWLDMSRLMRGSLSFMLLVLMFITSFGIYAYLASSYASSASGLKSKENDIGLYTEQKTSINADIVRLSQRSIQLQSARNQQENRLDSLIAKGRTITGQQSIIRLQDNEIVDIQKQIRTLSARRDSLSTRIVTTTNSLSDEGKIGTFYYVSQSLGIPLDTIVQWFIIVIILVFDPLSVCLFFGYNVIVKKERNGENARDPKNSATSPIVPVEVSLTSSQLNTSDVALTEIVPLAKPENNMTELNTLPYYMSPDYNWQTDTRWHTDADARMYLSKLGVQPAT